MNLASQFGLLANPALDDQDAPLPTIAPAQPAPQGQLQPIRAASAPSMAPMFRPNMQRQQQERALQASLQPKPAPQGFWPKAAHILGNIGDVAGTIILGNDKMGGIPGTAQHSALQANATERELGTLENQDAADRKQFDTEQNDTSKRGLESSQANEADARADALKNPQGDYEAHDTTEGPMILNKKTGIAQHMSENGLPIGPKVQTKTVQLEIGGKPHQVLVSDADGSVIKDMGLSGEKPPQIHVETPNEERGAKNDILKAYQPALDSGERLNVMTDAYEKAVKNHDQQAMLNILANHLGMTMGLQKGSRLTRDIINEAETSTPWLEGMGAKFDKDGYLSGVTLTVPQMQKMVSLGQERYSEDTKKSRATAQYLGAKDDGPDRVPGSATINYYKSLTGGDGAKAKQLAIQDGWTVK
jgi:hypothetical protein